MQKLNKLELDHIKNRIDTISKCTNGEIATILNRIKKGTGLTDSRKYKFIVDGTATVMEEHEIIRIDQYKRQNTFECLLSCYRYPETITQEEKRAFNSRVNNKMEELMQEVTLEGKRIIDEIILGLISAEEVPGELHKLGSMTSIARTFKSSDFLKKDTL